MQEIFKKRLEALNKLNETKGQEQAALAAIPSFRADAVKESEWEAAAESYWQEQLTHQHIIMNNGDQDKSHRLAMLATAQMGLEIVNTHNLETLRGHAHRFLGRAYSYNNRHSEALAEYHTAQTIFAESGSHEILEINGFIAESLVRTGNVNQGLEQTYLTFESYDTSAIAIKLKEDDYYKWAVWRTGILPRLVSALEEQKINYDKSRIHEYVEKSKSLLVGPYDFDYRLKEIEDTLERLK